MSLRYAEKLSYRADVGAVGMPEFYDSPTLLQSKVAELAKLIRQSKHLVVFTGAGISTSCGIPDFRGPNGIWTLQHEGKPMPTAGTPFHQARPGVTHMALVGLQRAGILKYIISQNIDGLHLRSGIPRGQLAELHGNCFREVCGGCGKDYVRDFEMETIGLRPTGGRCSVPDCSSKLLDTIVDWEDALPPSELKLAEKHSKQADLTLCLGTSLQITPACNLPMKTVRAGGKLVIVNLQVILTQLWVLHSPGTGNQEKGEKEDEEQRKGEFGRGGKYSGPRIKELRCHRVTGMAVTIPYFAALTTYFSYGLLFVFGHLRDIIRGFQKSDASAPKGYAPLCRDFEDFYTRRLYHRIQDCFNRPICSAPDAWIDVVERKYDRQTILQRESKSRNCLNLGSYNYLGFAAHDEYCTPRVVDSLEKYGISTCASRVDGGTTAVHEELEKLIASFVGKPAALTFGMGFATNSTTLPVLVGKEDISVSIAPDGVVILHIFSKTGASASAVQRILE